MEVESQQMPRASPSKTNSKMSFYKSKNGKCQRVGPVGRNPYLNFLREFRKRNCGLSAVETIRRGAKEWKTLPKEKKLQYIEAAFYAPKRRRLPVPTPEDSTCCPKVTCPKMKPKTACPRKVKKRPKKNSCRKKRRRRNKCGKPRKPKRVKRSKKLRGCKKRRKRKSCKC